MWTNEHSIETAASADAIWRLWSDVPGWQQWIADIEQIEISGQQTWSPTWSRTRKF